MGDMLKIPIYPAKIPEFLMTFFKSLIVVRRWNVILPGNEIRVDNSLTDSSYTLGGR